MPEKADQLFPLSRLSRVVCKGIVEWSMSAMLACADAGINLIFLHKNGELRAEHEQDFAVMAALYQEHEDRCYLLVRSILSKLQQFLLAIS
jgi:CRISPR/Cas system-associated endonuclease Cas1